MPYGYRFMHSKNTKSLFYIYSYGKLRFELRMFQIIQKAFVLLITPFYTFPPDNSNLHRIP